MIHKIIKIQNCGRFVDYKPSEKEYGWNGIFSRKNTIYAENGSGKTTFTQILKSLSGKCCSLVAKRKSLQTKSPVSVSVLDDANRKLSYNIDKWDAHLLNIEVYDNYYAENNIYIISLGSQESLSNLYDLLPDGNMIMAEIQKWKHKRKNLSANIRNIRRELKMVKDSQRLCVLNDKYNRLLEKKKEYLIRSMNWNRN